MSRSYCIKKTTKKTEDIDPTYVRSKNNRLMLFGSCGIIKTLDELLKLGAISKDQHEKLYIGYLI